MVDLSGGLRLSIERVLRELLSFVGAARGIEARLLPEAGIDHTLLPGRGIQRSFSLANVGAAVGILQRQQPRPAVAPQPLKRVCIVTDDNVRGNGGMHAYPVSNLRTSPPSGATGSRRRRARGPATRKRSSRPRSASSTSARAIPTTPRRGCGTTA